MVENILMKNPKHQTHTTKYIKITKNGKLDKRILTAQTAVPAPYSYQLAITTPRSTTSQLGHLWCDHLDFIEKRQNMYTTGLSFITLVPIHVYLHILWFLHFLISLNSIYTLSNSNYFLLKKQVQWNIQQLLRRWE